MRYARAPRPLIVRCSTDAASAQEARRLDASLGFLEYGMEKNALKQDGRYYDEILMAKDLTEAGS